MKRIILPILFFSQSLWAQDYPSFEKALFVKGSDTLPYRIQRPLNEKPGRKYPLVLFLHGAGERGRDNNLQLFWGGSLFADPLNRKHFPAIVIFPQCGNGNNWGRYERKDSSGNNPWSDLRFLSHQPPTMTLSLVMQLLDSMVSSGQVDPRRIYVGGLSMGGMGTFELIWRKPGFFAAALPICGGGDPDKVALYAGRTTVWVFHGDSDPVVPVSNSRTMVEAYKKTGVAYRYTEYPGVQHDSWKNAFAEPDLLQWLFSQKKKR